MTWHEVHLVEKYPHTFPEGWRSREAWDHDKGRVIRIGMMYTRSQIDAMGWICPIGCQCQQVWEIHPEDAAALYGTLGSKARVFACRAILEMD